MFGVMRRIDFDFYKPLMMIVFLWTITASVVAGGTEELTSLTVTEAYTLSLNRLERIQISKEEYRAAEALYWQSVSAIFPQISFVAEQRFQNNASSQGGGGSSSSGSSSSGSSGSGNQTKQSFAGRFNIQQPLFKGFREFNGAASLKSQSHAAFGDYLRARQTLYYDVADVYFQLLGHESDIALLQAQQSTLGDRLNELKERVDLGRSRKGEQYQAEGLQADVGVLLEQTKGLRAAAKELLAFLVGLKADEFQLKDEMTLPTVEKLEVYLWKSGARPDIRAAADRAKSARNDVSVRKGEFAPEINAEANYYAVQDPDSNREWNILLTGTVPIFDGGLRYQRVKESKALQRKAELSLAEVTRRTESEVRTAYQNFISSVNQYLKLQDAVVIARENYEVQKKDYLLGRANNLDVLTGLTALQDDQRRLSSAEYQAKLNMIALIIASGEARQ